VTPSETGTRRPVLKPELVVRFGNQRSLDRLEFLETRIDFVFIDAAFRFRERDVMLEVAGFGGQQPAVELAKSLWQPRRDLREAFAGACLDQRTNQQHVEQLVRFLMAHGVAESAGVARG
jgi:hypothetical protein